ncbi:MAG TPA: HAMP domain-containing protein [Candidatus Gordonibacter avicola]|nr:HAMP domain-containing protein [Candidatus Gordonibacter avicola]
MLIAFYGVSRLVTRPLRKLGEASGKLEKHDFDVDLQGIGQRDEMEDLALRFDSMARELKTLYEHLESEVDVRTAQLIESNKALERQRIELEHMNSILQKDNELKEDFLATVSHELRTPLTSILAFVDLWEQTNTPRDSNEKKIMNEMKFSSRILLSMVNNMLDLTRIEAGRTDVSKGPVDVADLLGIVRDDATFLAEKKAAKLSLAVDENVPVVLTDGDKLRRILENLVSNAIKFIDAGGHVDLRASFDETSALLTLKVCDDGCGIDPNEVPGLFERFAKGSHPSASFDRSYGSSGLGLALVKDLVEVLEGTIEVDSCVGRGSSFTITIPVEPIDWLDEEE